MVNRMKRGFMKVTILGLWPTNQFNFLIELQPVLAKIWTAHASYKAV